MSLFHKDNLSCLVPEFEALPNGKDATSIQQLSLYHWGQLLKDVDHINVFKGSNASSKNYLLSCGNKKYVLKEKVDKASLENHIQWLSRVSLQSQHHFPVPVIYPTGSGDTIVDSKGKYWSLYNYIEGEYFLGGSEQIANALKYLARLTTALKILHSQSYESAKFGYFQKTLTSLELLLDKGNLDRMEISGNERLLINSTIKELIAFLENRSFPIDIIHLDYHPLNLLYRENKVIAILDFERVLPFPLFSGFGFSVYKLLRESIAQGKTNISEAQILTKDISGIFKQESDRYKFSVKELGYGALFRTLWILEYILSSYCKRKDKTFLYDLTKQIRSLKEIKILFLNEHKTR